MPRTTARIALLLALLACLPVGPLARAAAGPAGQFQPSRGDRDGDGSPDAADCAPDDPSRPSRSGTDADCDGAADPAGEHAASTPSGKVATRTAARRAAGEPVRAVRGLALGPAIAVYAPSTPRHGVATLIFAAGDNAGVTVRPAALVPGHARSLAVRTRSVARGDAFVVRVRAPHGVARVRFRVVVVDAAGNRYAATRTVRAG